MKVVKDKSTGRFVTMWNDKTSSKLAHLYFDLKWSMRKCAAEFKCSHSAIQIQLYRLDLARRKGKLNPTRLFIKANKNKLLRAYVSGKSAEALAEKYELEVPVLVKFFKHYGVFRDTAKARYENAAKHGAHWSVAQVAFLIKMYTSIDYERLPKSEYIRLVQTLSDHMYRAHISLLDIDGLRGRVASYQLDHICCIRAGFLRKVNGELTARACRIPPMLMAHPANLRVITTAENQARKGSALSFNAKALRRRIEKFEAKHGDPYKKFL